MGTTVTVKYIKAAFILTCLCSQLARVKVLGINRRMDIANGIVYLVPRASQCLQIARLLRQKS